MFGLRPISRSEEGDIVKGWLEREERRGLAIGQLWYLISMDWWRNWNDYVSNTTKVLLILCSCDYNYLFIIDCRTVVKCPVIVHLKVPIHFQKLQV